VRGQYDAHPKTMSPSFSMCPRLVMTVYWLSLTPKSFSLATTHSARRIFLSTPLRRSGMIKMYDERRDVYYGHRIAHKNHSIAYLQSSYDWRHHDNERHERDSNEDKDTLTCAWLRLSARTAWAPQTAPRTSRSPCCSSGRGSYTANTSPC
jgi:hypothetical protein